jgi:PAS domain S-box-containing protein
MGPPGESRGAWISRPATPAVPTAEGEGGGSGAGGLNGVAGSVPVAVERAASAEAARGVSVLVVDDTAEKLLALCASLEGLPIEVVPARSGEEALRWLLKRDFAVVLLDVAMPGLSGFEIARLVRQRLRTEHTPIIFVTSIGTNDAQVAEGYELGAVDYIFAPVNHHVLRAKVMAFVELFGKTRLLGEQAEQLAAQTRELAASRQSFRSIVDKSADGIAVVDARNVVRFANPAAVEFFGRDGAAIVGEPFGHRIEPGCTADIEVERPHGQRLVAEVSAVSTEWEGAPATLCVLRDVTPRKQAEARLAEEKERLSVTLRSLRDAVVTTDTAGRVVLMNSGAELLLGVELEEARGAPLRALVDRHEGKAGIGRALESVLEQQADGYREGRSTLAFAAGDERVVHYHVAPVIDAAGASSGAVLVLRDITEQQRIEAEVLRTNKLESLGVLAGGIAHDFNNILTGVMANVSLAEALVRAQNASAADRLRTATRACERARDLTRQLLTFSKGGAPIREILDLRELLSDAVELVLGGSSVACDVRIAEELWAVEAMPHGGQVVLRADNVVHEGDPSLPLNPGPHVRVSISDAGPGIPPEVLPRVFDPFFTTKDIGTGLGLSTTFSILQKHDGHVAIASDPAGGTTVEMYIPAQPDRAQSKPRDRCEEPVPGTGTILVMDDEWAIRELAGQCLAQLGYEARFASTGEEAISAY